MSAPSLRRRRRRTGRHLLTVAVLLALGSTLLGATRAAPTAAATERPDEPGAVALLERAAGAADQLSFSGTQYVTAWSSVDAAAGSASAILDVSHRAGGPTSIWRTGGGAVQTGGAGDGGWLPADAGPVDLLADAYVLQRARTDRVAGRPADVVRAVRSDGSLAAEFWLDQRTGLLLRREVRDATSRVVSASAFVEIEIDDDCCDRPAPAPSAAEAAQVRGVTLDHGDLAELRDAGYGCVEHVAPGFALYQATQHDGAVQTSYSDGLATLSVFEQPGALDPQQMAGYQRHERAGGTVWISPGPPVRAVWSRNGVVVTAVTDAPMDVLDGALEQLPPDHVADPADEGWLDRVARGGSKMVSWLNPFD